MLCVGLVGPFTIKTLKHKIRSHKEMITQNKSFGMSLAIHCQGTVDSIHLSLLLNVLRDSMMGRSDLSSFSSETIIEINQPLK
jgi:hypothetical protein